MRVDAANQMTKASGCGMAGSRATMVASKDSRHKRDRDLKEHPGEIPKSGRWPQPPNANGDQCPEVQKPNHDLRYQRWRGNRTRRLVLTNGPDCSGTTGRLKQAQPSISWWFLNALASGSMTDAVAGDHFAARRLLTGTLYDEAVNVG